MAQSLALLPCTHLYLPWVRGIENIVPKVKPLPPTSTESKEAAVEDALVLIKKCQQ
jgi:hypothetical protein